MGHGPAISMFSFHGRGTLNGVIPHPAIVSLLKTAEHLGINLQRSVHSGALTDLSYVQTVGKGVAVDLGFPMRYSHSSLEVCDLNDLTALTKLLIGALDFIQNNFTLIGISCDMTYTLGIDVGTFETKGSLVDHSGNLLGQAKRARKMLVPKVEHRPEEDWVRFLFR